MKRNAIGLLSVAALACGTAVVASAWAQESPATVVGVLTVAGRRFQKSRPVRRVDLTDKTAEFSVPADTTYQIEFGIPDSKPVCARGTSTTLRGRLHGQRIVEERSDKNVAAQVNLLLSAGNLPQVEDFTKLAVRGIVFSPASKKRARVRYFISFRGTNAGGVDPVAGHFMVTFVAAPPVLIEPQ